MKISKIRFDESYKLRFYNKRKGLNQGNLDHEEFFDTKEEAVSRYKEVFDKNSYSLNPTVWVGDDDNWKRLSEAEINESLNESDRPDDAPIDFWEPSGEDADEYYQINILTDMFDADPSRFEQALEDFGYNPTNYDNFDSFLKDVDKVDLLNKFADLLQKNDELNSSWYDHFDFTEAPLPFDFDESLKEDFEDYEDRLFYRKSDRLENSVEKRFPGWKIFVEGSWQCGIGSDFIYIYPPDDIELKDDDDLSIYLNGSFLDISNREILKLIAQKITPVIQANESLKEDDAVDDDNFLTEGFLHIVKE